MMGKEPYVRGMWECFLQERNRVKRFRELAREYLEHLKEWELGIISRHLHKKEESIGMGH